MEDLCFHIKDCIFEIRLFSIFENTTSCSIFRDNNSLKKIRAYQCSAWNASPHHYTRPIEIFLNSNMRIYIGKVHSVMLNDVEFKSVVENHTWGVKNASVFSNFSFSFQISCQVGNWLAWVLTIKLFNINLAEFLLCFHHNWMIKTCILVVNILKTLTKIKTKLLSIASVTADNNNYVLCVAANATLLPPYRTKISNFMYVFAKSKLKYTPPCITVLLY